MYNLLETFGADEEKTIRRSLITLSISSIIFQKVEFVESILNLFVIEIIFQKQEVTLLVKYGIILLLLIFLITATPNYLKKVYELRKRRLEISRKSEVDRLENEWDLNVPCPYEDTPEDQQSRIRDDFEIRTSLLSERYNSLLSLAIMIKIALLNFLMPVLLAVSALLDFPFN